MHFTKSTEWNKKVHKSTRKCSCIFQELLLNVTVWWIIYSITSLKSSWVELLKDRMKRKSWSVIKRVTEVESFQKPTEEEGSFRELQLKCSHEYNFCASQPFSLPFPFKLSASRRFSIVQCAWNNYVHIFNEILKIIIVNDGPHTNIVSLARSHIHIQLQPHAMPLIYFTFSVHFSFFLQAWKIHTYNRQWMRLMKRK